MRKALHVIRALYLLLALLPQLHAAHVRPVDSYLHAENDRIDLIVAKEYRSEIPRMLAYESSILNHAEKTYGYRLDDRLYQVLASSHNQIANAFSTQMPLNMQVNYIGGTLRPDYFASASWLKTIMIHETMHNFQLNAKANPLSRTIHKVVKNSPVTWLYFTPVFPLPNLTESPFILEGNAVLNESLYGNGGRLYNGTLRAMAMTQAKAGYITPERSYNDHLFFPYGAHHYIVGGFFQLFLAQRYGVAKVDRYFLSYSKQWLPFFTNAVFRDHFGESFETLLQAYAVWMEKEAEGFVETQGEEIAFSKAYAPLNGDKDAIYFLASDLHAAPMRITLHKSNGSVDRKATHHLFGKLFRLDGKYYSLASAEVSPTKTMIGLFDEEGRVKSGSLSRALQTTLPDGTPLWFDISRSYDRIHLYRGREFVGYVNSSVISDRAGDYYYFRQNAKKRTLYRDTTPLFSYEGYFGKVVDVDSRGRVLFVANSAKGATLYRFDGFQTQRLLQGDDILDARLINDTHAVVATIGADGISYRKCAFAPKREGVHATRYFFEDAYRLETDTNTTTFVSKPHPYRALQNLHYSALEQYVEFKDGGGVNFNLSAAWTDPLERNHLRLFSTRSGDETRAGIGYDNSAARVNYGAALYTLLSKEQNSSDRDFGLDLFADYPYYRAPYHKGDLSLSYHLDSDRNGKSPLALTLRWQQKRHYPLALYPQQLHRFSLFATEDRADRAFGGRYDFMHALDTDREIYLGAGMHYAQSSHDGVIATQRGIKVDESDFTTYRDPARVVMPSLKTPLYVHKALRTELSLAKVFDYHSYHFSLPLSLRREALYGTYRHFLLQDRNRDFNLDEYTLGMTLELLLLHKLVMPLQIEYLKNDDLKRAKSFRVLFNLAF